jgi:hypothetical protein
MWEELAAQSCLIKQWIMINKSLASGGPGILRVCIQKNQWVICLMNFTLQICVKLSSMFQPFHAHSITGNTMSSGSHMVVLYYMVHLGTTYVVIHETLKLYFLWQIFYVSIMYVTLSINWAMYRR